MAKEYHYIPCRQSTRSIVTGNGQSTEGLHVSIDINHAVDIKEMANDICHATSLTPSDVIGVIECLRHEMETVLLTGQTVSLEGIGTFALSIGTRHPMYRGQKIRSRDICVKGITFRPARSLTAKMEEARVTVKEEYDASASYTEMLALLRAHMADDCHGGLISVAQLATLTRCHRSTAHRRLHQLCADGILAPCPYIKGRYVRGEAFEEAGL